MDKKCIERCIDNDHTVRSLEDAVLESSITGIGRFRHYSGNDIVITHTCDGRFIIWQPTDEWNWKIAEITDDLSLGRTLLVIKQVLYCLFVKEAV